ncbi:MAG: polysaccharide deacetylase family protein [Syntrophales bacterium]|nr:polysaccharide deacetylase family protein [Syntrophales bacterium]
MRSIKRAGVLGLKIDVDTYIGMKKGVPRLLSILDEMRVKGTFFLSIGPDASGRAVLQLIKNPRFLKKMMRTNAVSLYGIRTALYGTLLPSPLIAMSFPDIVQRIIDQGHEVQFHAWDHRRWQDEIKNRSAAWLQEWFEKGIHGFERLVGHLPTSFGAPAWRIDNRVMGIIKKYHFEYLSCTRAKAPFIHENSGLLEIPSDLPCFEEIGFAEGGGIIETILQDGGIHVLPAHAEVEGGVGEKHFVKLLHAAKSMDYQIKPLGEIKDLLKGEDLTTRKYQTALLPGRSVPCAV